MGTTIHTARGHSQKGQALLEMALVTPLLLAMALGVIELGRYAYISILVGSAARAGAVYGAQGVTYANSSPQLPCSSALTGIQQAACADFSSNGQALGTLEISSSVSCGCDTNGSLAPSACSTIINASAGTCINGHWVVMVSVEAAGTFNSLFNYPGIPKSITVDRTATMRVAQQ